MVWLSYVIWFEVLVNPVLFGAKSLIVAGSSVTVVDVSRKRIPKLFGFMTL